MPRIEPTQTPGVVKVLGTYTTSWRATVDLGRDPQTGKRRQQSRTFPTYRAAVDWRLATRHARREGSYIQPSDEPFGVFLGRWLASLSRPGPSSRRHYQQLIRLHIQPTLGDLPLGALSPERLDTWLAGMARAGLSASLRRQVFGLVKRALTTAVRWRLLATNPAAACQAPAPERAERTVWTADQARAFLRFTADDPLAAAWRLLVMFGLRRGEVLALGWDDIEFDRARLTVRRTITHDLTGQWTLGAPKTPGSRRLIPLPPSCLGPLRVHHYRQAERRELLGAAWHDQGLVFERGDGRLCNPNTLYAHFQRLRAAAGLPKIRPHDLRHSAATLMLTDLGLPLIVVSRILGHSQVGITGDTYGHVDEHALWDAAARVERLFVGGDGEGLAD